MASPRLCKPSESSTPNHAHTRIKKNKWKNEKRKKENKRKERKKKKTYKCYVKCSFHSEQFSTVSSLCVEKRGDPYWSVLYRHQFQNCDRRHQSVQHDRQTTWMPTRWDIISCKEYGTWYYLFIRPTEEPIAKDISQSYGTQPFYYIVLHR